MNKRGEKTSMADHMGRKERVQRKTQIVMSKSRKKKGGQVTGGLKEKYH